MATTTQLADRVSLVTGLQSSAGTERTLVVQALNNAYQNAVETAGLYRGTSSVSLTNGTDDYELASSPFSLTDVNRIIRLTVTGGGLTKAPMRHVSEDYLLSLREGITAGPGATFCYAIGGVNMVRLWPIPGSGLTVVVHYDKAAPELVESGATGTQETTPSKIPARFHWDVIAAGAIVEALDKDQRGADASFWLQRYEQGLQRLVRWANEFGGEPTQMQFGSDGFVPREADQRGW